MAGNGWSGDNVTTDLNSETMGGKCFRGQRLASGTGLHGFAGVTAPELPWPCKGAKDRLFPLKLPNDLGGSLQVAERDYICQELGTFAPGASILTMMEADVKVWDVLS